MNDIDVSKYFKPSLKQARRRTRNETETLEFKIEEKHLLLGYGRKYYIQTFGCQGNEADSEIMSGILENMAYEKTSNFNDSDVIIVNTCAIRENAEDKVWGTLGRYKQLKRNNPDLILAVAGCMPQEEVVVEKILKTYSHVDIIMGTHNIHKLPYYIETAIFAKEKVIEVYSNEGNIVEKTPKVRSHKYKAWVNIMFGCNEFCTYCIVPFTRGKERSRNREEIIEEVKTLYESGYKEVTLLGQNVNAYGLDFKDKIYTFGDLLKDLDKIGIERIRFTTSHPHDIDLKTMLAMKNSKHIMPHFHLPVQSGSNNIIKKMNRRYTKESYLKVLEELRRHVPEISITTDIIVGFPGETDDDFEATLDLVKKAKFEGAFTYLYSKREGTPAAKFQDNMSEIDKKKRLYRLNELINEGYLKGNLRFLNKSVKVLVEGKSKYDDNVLAGYSEHNKLVNFKGNDDLIGKIVDVKITIAKTWFLMGELI